MHCDQTKPPRIESDSTAERKRQSERKRREGGTEKKEETICRLSSSQFAKVRHSNGRGQTAIINTKLYTIYDKRDNHIHTPPLTDSVDQISLKRSAQQMVIVFVCSLDFGTDREKKDFLNHLLGVG